MNFAVVLKCSQIFLPIFHFLLWRAQIEQFCFANFAESSGWLIQCSITLSPCNPQISRFVHTSFYIFESMPVVKFLAGYCPLLS